MPDITLEAIKGLLAEQKQDILKAVDEKLAQQNREVMVLIESEFNPKFNLLMEGQQELRGLITPKSRIEELENEITVLKMAISKMSEDIRGLQKAQ